MNIGRWCRIAIALSTVAPSCYQPYDTSTEIYLAPSAEEIAPEVSRAVDRINTRLGRAVLNLYTTDNERFHDGRVVVRVVGALKGKPEKTFGLARMTSSGVMIELLASHRPSEAEIAHELLHAAGLDHVEDADVENVMHAFPTKLQLNDQQVEYLLAAFPEKHP